MCVRPPGWLSGPADTVQNLVAWAQRAETLGLDGVFVGDRMLGEATGSGGQVVYGASMLDATVALSAIAACTERIVVGPLVFVFPYRHPLQIAKTFASLDAVSGGRVVLGAGIGWNAREFEALGIPMAGRADRFEEALPLVRRLWSGEPVSHTGTWELHDVRIVPPPAQPGGPPFWLASFSPGQPLHWTDRFPAPAVRQLERVGRLADGWVPLVYSASAKRRLSPRALGAAWDIVSASARAAGRSREDLDFVYSDWCYVLDGPRSVERCKAALSRFFSGSWEDARRTYTIGTAEEVVAAIAQQTASIDRIDGYVLTPLSDEPEQLELFAGLAGVLRQDRRTERS